LSASGVSGDRQRRFVICGFALHGRPAVAQQSCERVTSVPLGWRQHLQAQPRQAREDRIQRFRVELDPNADRSRFGNIHGRHRQAHSPAIIPERPHLLLLPVDLDIAHPILPFAT
jgi:hypothetical protein